jgi:hypothetical protein
MTAAVVMAAVAKAAVVATTAAVATTMTVVKAGTMATTVVAELPVVAGATTAVTMAATMKAIVDAAATVTATTNCGIDNGSNSNGSGHRHPSTKSSSEDTLGVATAMETAAADTATTAMGTPATVPGVGADRIAFATAVGAATIAMGTVTSAPSAARTAWRFGRGLAHIVQYLPPLMEEAHDPHSQLEAEEEEVMMGGLWVLVVRVV